jgi:hypothetical protein
MEVWTLEILNDREHANNPNHKDYVDPEITADTPALLDLPDDAAAASASSSVSSDAAAAAAAPAAASVEANN